ncbi:hypothetical protein EVG20_g10664 [Dentipellis fragilis]|uniref:Uncharacterized protein n=1 Tax=Dentipellis fragilis TaxID=205917 RepID=A0A4Y9XR07_9AGAM|nr:hypothetical protein EVG20_g10664 [Dentipellis fragilis]
MPDTAKNCRSKSVGPSLGSLVRTFAPGSSGGISLLCNNRDSKSQVEAPRMSNFMSRSTLAVLKDIAEMFDFLPCIRVAAGIVLWIIEIQNVSERFGLEETSGSLHAYKQEISDLGDKWLELVERLNTVVNILREVRKNHQKFKSEADLPEDLNYDLHKLAEYVSFLRLCRSHEQSPTPCRKLQLIQEALRPYTTHQSAFWKRITYLLKRTVLIKEVEKCSRELDTCLQGFTVRILVFNEMGDGLVYPLTITRCAL